MHFGIDQLLVTSYQHSANGGVERIIRIIAPRIKKQLMYRWPEHLPFVQMTHNLGISSVTNSSPFELMYGREGVRFKDHSAAMPVWNRTEFQRKQKQLHEVIYGAVRIGNDNAKRRGNAYAEARRKLVKDVEPGAIVFARN